MRNNTDIMADDSVTKTFETIQFPRRIVLIDRLRQISFIVNDITIAVSFLTLFIWVTNLFGIRYFIFQLQALHPFTPVLFIFSGIPLLFGAKTHLANNNATIEKLPRWVYTIPIFFAVITGIFGLLNFLHLTFFGLITVFHIAPFTGFCFFLIGLALIPPFTQIHHRFHITQFLIFIISGLNVYVILENMYQIFSPSPVQHVFNVSLLTAYCFVFFCSGLLLRWSNRGFMGNFTLDSTASIFALRIFILNLFSAPIIALIVLFLMQHLHYNMFIILTIVVICFAFISSLTLWMNVKILYGHELEHLLMRESLRSHNIDLTKEQKDLQNKIGFLEEEKNDYLDKLKNESRWMDAAEKLG
jgi:hypothetical protein